MFTKLWEWFRLSRYQAKDRAQTQRSQRRTMGQRARVFVTQGPVAATKAEARHAANRAHGHACGAPVASSKGASCMNPVMIGAEGHATGACYIRSHQDWARNQGQAQDERAS